MLVMLLAPVVVKARHGVLAAISLLGLALALAATRLTAIHSGLAYSGLFRADAFSLFVHLIVIGAAFLAILGSTGYLKREDLDPGEFCALILFATAGMGVMAGAHELITAFIGLEMSSIASYVLASYKRDAPRANEAAMKYFLLGSFATAFFLYGIALSFGATGSTHLDMMTPLANDSSHVLLKIGLGFIFVGLAFKVAAAPFQLWTPDVYEGAPAPVTALLSTGPKAAAFALALRILASVDAAPALWFWALWVAAVLSMFVGNLSALVQTSVKRMLAYSSIAHAGYILAALAAAAATDHAEAGIVAALFYLVGYALVKLSAFLIVGHLGGAGERHMQVEDFAGLARRQPAMAACFLLFLLSLLGLPITAGFLGKFYVFNAALETNLTGMIWLAILLGLNSVIAAYYYLRVIVTMYMREPKQEIIAEPVPWTLSATLWIAAAGTIYVGLFPARIIDFAAKAALNIR
jgi:NADH-quinone oxidoreductase subunit N